MSNIVNMVKSARESNPTSFANAFQNEINSRVGEMISLRRTQIVGNMFSVTESEEPDEDDSDEGDEELSEDDSSILEAMSDEELINLIESLGQSVRKGAVRGAAVGAAVGAGVAHFTHGQHAAGAYAGAVGGAAYGAAAGAAVHGAKKLATAAKKMLAKRRAAKAVRQAQ